MSGADAAGISEDGCRHCNIVDLERDGDSVCTDCGLVVAPLLLPYYESSSSSIGNSGDIPWADEFPLWRSGSSTDRTRRISNGESKDAEMREFIVDICVNAEIPNNVTRYAVKYYGKLRREQRQQPQISVFSRQTIASYAIYEALNQFEVPRLVEEVAYLTGVKRERIWQVEAELASLGVNGAVHEPEHYVSRYCNLLGLSYPEQLMIQDAVACLNSAVDRIPLGNLHCNCLVGVVIYLLCKLGKKHNPSKTTVTSKLSLMQICDTCDISATSIHRVIRQMKLLSAEMALEQRVAWILPIL